MAETNLLCIDIGNTNIKLGYFEDGEMVQRWRISTDRMNLADEYGVLIADLLKTKGLLIEDLNGCAISSVVPSLTQEFIEVSEKYFGLTPVIYDQKMDIKMKINTDIPGEVGHDLIMNALAARKIFGSPVIVVGFGTATSFVVVSEKGDLEGVLIAPGVITSTESLFRSTSTLPLVALKHPTVTIGKNTIESMRAGIIYGFVGLVKEIVSRIKKELNSNPTVVATGGMSQLIGNECDAIDYIQPNLALLGLKEMHTLYQMKKG